MAGSKDRQTKTFAVPLSADEYAPERLTLLPSPSTLDRPLEVIGVTALLVSGPAGAVVELWLPILGATRGANGEIDDAEYVYSGQFLEAGAETWPLAHWPGGVQLRVKSGGAAGDAIVHASAD